MKCSLIACLVFLGIASLSSATAADNCTGYDNLVSTYFEERDLGQGMKLQTFAQESILTSDHAAYHLATGQCSGSALMTPDGKVSAMGYCARRDKDGDTQSIDWHLAPGAEKGSWRSTGGTGKFAGRTDSGWFQDVRSDGKMAVAEWGGTCK
jgi:hypothetical protein